jgi:hypothetical protein
VSQTPAVTGKQLVKVLEGRAGTSSASVAAIRFCATRPFPTRSPSPSTAAIRSKKGTLGNILRTAGISREQFDRLL